MRSESIVLLLIVLGLLVGCAGQRTVLENSAVDIHSSADAELDFWDDVATRRVVTNNDALHGLLLLALDSAAAETYEARLDRARQRGWIAQSATPPPNESATAGVISVAVCEILEIEGGLTMWVFGPSPRYCTRELIYLELMPRRSEYQSLSGLEFIDLINRAEDHMAVSEAVATPETGGETPAESG